MASEIPEPGCCPRGYYRSSCSRSSSSRSCYWQHRRRINKTDQTAGTVYKEKKQDPSTDIEAQLEAARERLRRFNEMEMEEKRMRKMMSSMKKGTAVAMAAVMCISLAGCGGSTKKVVADKKETTATTTAAETQTETAQETEAVNDSDMAEILQVLPGQGFQ